MKKVKYLGIVALGVSLLAACQKNDDALTKDPVLKSGTAVECVSFSSISAGAIVSSVYTDAGSGPIGVFGINPSDPNPNAAMIFDSDNITGNDPDLGTPNQDFNGPGIGTGGQSGSPYQNDVTLGNVLIVSEDLDGNDPDDLNGAGEFKFDFTQIGPVTIHSLSLLDIEGKEGSPVVTFYDDVMNVLATFNLPTTGDNGYENVSFGPQAGVSYMNVAIGGSGAIDDLCIELPPPPPPSNGCTHTIGYWKTHAGTKKQPDVVSQYLSIYLGNNGGSKTLMVASNLMAVDVLYQKVYGKPSNGITKLYAQLLAAKLSIADGADGTPVSTVITDADNFLANNDWNDWGSLSKSMKNQVLAWKDALDDYNNGESGVAHCP